MAPAEFPKIEPEPPPVVLVPLPDPDFDKFGQRDGTGKLRPMGAQGDIPSDAVTHEHKGQKRWSRNTAFLTRRVDDLVRAGFDDPMQVLMEIASGFKLEESLSKPGTFVKVPLIKIDHKSRVIAASELLSYIYPKRKSVEVSTEEGASLTFNLNIDAAPIPEMPSDAELEAMALERRKAQVIAQRTIDGG